VRFNGQVVIVAGGAGGLGQAVSLAFAEEGANVVVPYRSDTEFERLRAALGEGAALAGSKVEVTDQAAVDQFISSIIARHHAIDVMENTVGGYAGGIKLWELDAGTLERMLALNLRSGYVLAHSVVPYMLKQGNGAIVNVAAKAALDHAAGAAAYAASKAAALALMDSLAADLKGSGIRVNSILPCIIDTEANRKAMPAADYSKWPKPEEIARVILFLCSDDARVIHGAAIPVYGYS
jgi:NAD(P)-dependent dehydrogenase (short-subunit alcohol dehydrogenase family)